MCKLIYKLNWIQTTTGEWERERIKSTSVVISIVAEATNYGNQYQQFWGGVWNLIMLRKSYLKIIYCRLKIKWELKIKSEANCKSRPSVCRAYKQRKKSSRKNRNRWLHGCESVCMFVYEHDPIYLFYYIVPPCTAVHNGKFHFSLSLGSFLRFSLSSFRIRLNSA